MGLPLEVHPNCRGRWMTGLVSSHHPHTQGPASGLTCQKDLRGSEGWYLVAPRSHSTMLMASSRACPQLPACLPVAWPFPRAEWAGGLQVQGAAPTSEPGVPKRTLLEPSGDRQVYAELTAVGEQRGMGQSWAWRWRSWLLHLALGC